MILTNTVQSKGFVNHVSDFDLNYFQKLHPERRLFTASEEIVRDLRTL
jgi:hypothetical protein